MKAHRLLWLVWGLLAFAALVMAFQVLRASREASVIVEWSTASELDTAGFNLYRSEQDEGPFTQVNEFIIPAAPDPLIGGDYEFVDTAVTPGERYFYKLEEVESSGARAEVGMIEVRAARSGGLELVLAIVLFGGALMGFFLQIRAERSRR